MMKNKQETIEKIKQAALEEFYANGYAKASLRTICHRAGVTTGAMYFSFENKEALLRAILEPLVENYEKMLAKSMQIELENPSEGPEIDVYVMQFILKHRKETIVIMEKAQGSCYEGLIKILAKQRLDSCLQIVKEDYDMEYSLYLVKKIGIYAGGGTERLIESLRKLHRD